MAHLHGDPLYRRLGAKIDGLQLRTPWSPAFAEMLAALYTPDEAELVLQMPFGFATLARLEQITHWDRTRLQKILDELCIKGLVMDLFVKDEFHYMISPLFVGIFELVMMRTGSDLPSKQWAELFHRYMNEGAVFAANAAHGERVPFMRTLPHEETVLPSTYTEVLDYEKASAIVEDTSRFAIGLCSCRHEKSLIGEKKCAVPLDTCVSFGVIGDLGIRHGFAREASKTEVLENLARSRELRLVLTADNVQKRVNFICQCCKDCCNLLLGVTRHGYPGWLVTSNFISQVDGAKCTGCGRCVEPRPVNAIMVVAGESKRSKRGKVIQIDEKACIGCGVCGLVCALDGIHLVKRKERVLHPETTFERVILMCLERGTLQNQLFDDPSKLTHQVMRGIVGGFLRLPPIKQNLMSEQMRSQFLAAMTSGVQKQGKGWVAEL